MPLRRLGYKRQWRPEDNSVLTVFHNAMQLENSLTLLTFFGLNSPTTRFLAFAIISLPLAYLALRLRYPCVTSRYLLRAVANAKETFNKCVATDSFENGEYEPFLQDYCTGNGDCH
ncbi:hypothetical protein L218DRAFT_958496 [Marasmius fiardii PR-910]|nr:hypothetical protein L218DRAFT_958496 [Marasmius fiardii PR-910]